jgi:D-inositol-3-phosphate glycosyltransferase
MLLGQTVPYVRERNQFTSGDWFGSQVASHDLVEAVLAFSTCVEGVHIFEPIRAGCGSPATPPEDFALQKLDARIKRVSSSDLTDSIARHRYMFLTHGIDFHPLGQLRLADEVAPFPMCAFLHSIESPNVMLTYASAHIYSEPFDSIIVTSSAGERAVRMLWDSAADLLRIRMRTQSQESPRIVRIPLGINTDVLAPRDRVEARRLLGLPAEALIILYLGRLTDDDKADLEPLIGMFSRLRRQADKLHLLIAGQDVKGRYTPEVWRMAQQAGIAKAVTVAPNFPYALKPYVYSASDIFVSPVDNVQETFGISVIEAMACGLPVVASDWSGYRDLVEDGRTGFLIPTYWNAEHARRVSVGASAADASFVRYALAQRTVVDPECLENRLQELVRAQDLRAAFGATGRARAVAGYAWPSIVKSLDALWLDQWEQVAHTFKRSRFLLDYGKAFGHFPTAVVDASLELTLAREADRPIMPPVSAGFRSGAAVGALRGAKAGDRLHAGSEEALWLWKKGFLAPPRKPQPDS